MYLEYVLCRSSRALMKHIAVGCDYKDVRRPKVVHEALQQSMSGVMHGQVRPTDDMDA